MRKIITVLVFVLSVNLSAQNKYEKAMTSAFQFWEVNNTKAASQLFERVSNAEKEKWLPPFYVATIEILKSFQLKDEVRLKAALTKAQTFLDMAKANSSDNSEILITQALLNTVYIVFDGQKYGMSMSMKNAGLYAKALKLTPNNPRVILSKAESDMGTANFFGQPTTAFCKDVKRAITLGKNEKITMAFYPKFLLKRATKVLKKCEQK